MPIRVPKWLHKMIDPQGYALQELVNERVLEIIEQLRDGKELADVMTRVVQGPPEWNQAHQSWTVRDKALKVNRPILLQEGRGGKELEDAFVLNRLDEPDSEGVASYSITFDMPEEATNAS